jgi:hypothetical protein
LLSGRNSNNCCDLNFFILSSIDSSFFERINT